MEKRKPSAREKKVGELQSASEIKLKNHEHVFHLPAFNQGRAHIATYDHHMEHLILEKLPVKPYRIALVQAARGSQVRLREK